MAREALDAVAPWGMDVMAYYSDKVYIREMTPRLESYGERNNVVVDPVGDLSDMAAKGLTRLVVVGEDDEIERLEAHLQSRFDSALYVTRSLPYFCEILNPEGGKDKALDWFVRATSEWIRGDHGRLRQRVQRCPDDRVGRAGRGRGRGSSRSDQGGRQDGASGGGRRRGPDAGGAPGPGTDRVRG